MSDDEMVTSFAAMMKFFDCALKY